jgi:DNA polymerase (family X)
MNKEAIVDVLERIAQLLELQGENPFKVRAYRTGAEVVTTFPGDLVARAQANDLAGIKGLGDALQEKIVEFVTTGKLDFYEKLRAQFPATIFELFEINGLGPKKIAALYHELGVGSIPELKAALTDGRAAALNGFAAKTNANLLDAIAFREAHASTFRVDEAAESVAAITDFLRDLPWAGRVEVAGSFRRGKEVVRDLDFVVETKEPEKITEAFAHAPFAATIVVQGATKCSIRLANGMQCDVRAVSTSEYPFALAYFTGSKEHNVALRGLALKKGWTLNEYRLASLADEPSPPLPDEAALHDFLGLAYIDPALREGSGEIEAAAQDKLPPLVALENLRGTFHNHTTASDGNATLRAMAEAAIDLGLQYLGIADHSKSSFQANGLNEERLRAQIAEIRALNQEWDGAFRLFAGSEVDILKDGALDFDDALMGELDYVVASVHSVFNLSEADMTQRIIRAIEHPRVTMLGHLTGRLLLKRDAYALDVPRILDACAAHGKIIELNASPWRLDMDWRWWRMAKEKGIRCAINPDAHSVHGLQDLYHGVRIARKGWLTRADVVNCLPLGQIESVLHRASPRDHFGPLASS